jgi:hypothetical protein
MTKLAEIEAAAAQLPAEEKQKLILFLSKRLREEGSMPSPRSFTAEQMQGWINEDEEGYLRFLREQ